MYENNKLLLIVINISQYDFEAILNKIYYTVLKQCIKSFIKDIGRKYYQKSRFLYI